MANFYLDGTTLTNSTAVYDDVALTTLAADGYYSDGIISRQQVNGALLPATVCPSCTPPIPCTSIPTFPNGVTGRYSFNVNVGESASDVGAIVISFFTGVAPDGIGLLTMALCITGYPQILQGGSKVLQVITLS